MERIMVKILAALGIALCACAYDARYGPCAVQCTADSRCPDGLSCGPEGLCRDAEAEACTTCPAAYWTGPALTWSQAQAACEADGGHLAFIDDMPENENVVVAAAGLHVWIGYTDITEEGTWVWIEGTSTFTHWATGEPNNAGAGGTAENCAFLHAETYPGHVPDGMTGYWTDIACNTSIAYVCECGSP